MDIETSERILAGYRLSGTINYRKILEKSVDLLKQIGLFSTYERIAFVNRKNGDVLLLKEMGQITINDLYMLSDYEIDRMVCKIDDLDGYLTVYLEEENQCRQSKTNTCQHSC